VHYCKAPAKINRKMVNSTTCKIVTPENIILKFCTRDYVGEITRHARFQSFLVSIGTMELGASPQIGEILPPCDFFDCPFLSCPYFFSILPPGRTARPIFTLYGSYDVFPRKNGPFGVKTMGDHIWGNMMPKSYPSKNRRE